MAIALTISICLNIFQAFLFWFYMYGMFLKEQREQKERRGKE